MEQHILDKIWPEKNELGRNAGTKPAKVETTSVG
jgi:hypothetical protein